MFELNVDKQSFDYIVTEGAMILSTYQPSSRPFWVTLAPQLAHAHPAIMHGIVALGAIQGRIHHSSPQQLLKLQRPEVSAQALLHLTKAMKLLSLAPPDSVSTEVSLAACMLFLAIQIWMDRSAAPVVHIDAAQQMLRGYQRAVAANPLLRSRIVDQVYVPEYKSLVVNAITFSDGYPLPSSNVPANFVLDFRLDRAGSFTNINDAFDCLNNVIRCIIRLNAGQTMDGITEKVSRALDTFIKSLQKLRSNNSSMDCNNSANGPSSTDEQAHRALQMHHKVTIIMLQAVGSEDELAYDSHDKGFLYIVTECERLLMEDKIALPSNISSLASTLSPTFLHGY